MNISRIIKNIPLFNELKHSELQDISKKCKIKNIKKDEIVFVENSKGDSLYLILKGKILIYRTTDEDKIKTLAILERGDFFGEMAILSPSTRSASAKAITDTKLIVLNEKDFKKILKDNPQLTLKIIDVLSTRLRRANQEIELLSYRSVPERIKFFLLELARRKEARKKTVLKISQQDIAEMVATAREVVNRALRKLKENKIIKLNKGEIHILDLKKLEKFKFN